MLRFLDFLLDSANSQLRRGAQTIALRPKTLAVLSCLIERPGRLVTKAELLDAVWPDTAVSEGVLTYTVKELRDVLGDDARQPRIIETVHRRGYRFLPVVNADASAPRTHPGSQASLNAGAAGDAALGHRLVGRNADLQTLAGWMQRAVAGERQTVFVIGEAGIGKTTLVDEFLKGLGVRGGNPRNPLTPSVLIARGQCIEQHGAGEPYLPVLQALGSLCSGADGEAIVDLMRRHAPAWLVQLPGVLEPAEAEALERRLGTTTRERMLREMASLVAALPTPLVCVLEDLHWSDHATLDLMAMLAERREPARLLLIETYRPVDVVVREHPLKNTHQELRARSRCHDLWLQPLAEADVATYLTARWPGIDGAAELARVVHERTDGNPLFVVNVADYLVATGAVAEADECWTLRADAAQVAIEVPIDVRRMIAAQIDRLAEPEQGLLEAASLIGRTFSAALAAAALPADVVAVEQQLARLANAGQLLRGSGVSEWPDGTVAGAYSFTHSLYQTVLRERVPPARRRQLHSRIALRLEAAHGRHGADAAAELAYHFEKSGDPDRSVAHLEEAAARALRRGAGHAAVELLNRGLALVEPLVETPERTLQAIRLHLALALALPVLRGLGDPAAEQAALRARALSERTNDSVQLVQALAQLVGLYLAQARLERVAEAAEAMRRLMVTMPIPGFIAGGNILLGMVEYYFGKLQQAEDRFEQVLAMGDVPMPPSTGNPLVLALGNLSITNLQRGYPDKARNRRDQAMRQAAGTGRPFDRGMALQQSCFLLASLRDMAALREAAREALAHATEHDVASLHAVSTVHGGRVMVAGGDYESGAAVMREGVAAYRVNGLRVGLANMLSWLAEVHIDAENVAAAAPLVAEALAFVAETGVLPHAAELHRLDGEVHRLRGDRHAAEHSFRRAIDVARDQDARWWQLRATVSFARLQLKQRKSRARDEARVALAAIVGSFTEGFDTGDVQQAQALLAELS